MSESDQQQEQQIAQGLSQLGETTTAAELLRAKGQTRKLRVIGEKQLMAWILSLLQQHMAGKEDAFSDIEKAELLKKTQEELNRRIKREQEAQAERDRLKTELASAMAAVSKAQVGTTSQAEIDASLLTLREKLEQAEQINLDLQQDNYDLQDQLNEKMALLSTTISEKDKLRDTVRHQMMRMTTLCEGVLGIDVEYYGSKHQEENQVAEDASQDEAFYHDFDVGAKVITTLQADLERLRGISQRGQEAASDAAAEPKLLAGDLALLEQLKSGSLHAVDVAAPVAGLVEALDGARAEAEAFEVQVAEAIGAGSPQSFSDLPDGIEDPAEVLAASTTLVRELAASLARNRNRIAALKAIADESDEARHGTEEELELARAGFEQVCTALRQRAEAERITVPAQLKDRDAVVADRATAAVEIVEHFQGGAGGAPSPVEAAAIEQLALTDRLVRNSSPPVDPKTTDKQQVADRLRKAGHELERYTIDLQSQLDAAVARERALAEQVRELATGPAAVSAIAAEVIRAAEGDDELADHIADLSLAIENPESDRSSVEGMVREAVVRLGSRRRAAEAERARLAAEIVKRDLKQNERGAETTRLSNEGTKLKVQNAALVAALAQLGAGIRQRVAELGHAVAPALADPEADPEARARAGVEALAALADHRVIEDAAIAHLQTGDRLLAQTDGPKADLAAGARVGDEQAMAARLHQADVVLENHIRTLHQNLEATRGRERELARQVRELAVAHSISDPASVPRDDLARLERALADVGPGEDIAGSVRNVVTALKGSAARSGSEARVATARMIAAELVKAAEGDATLADSAADLAVAVEGDAADHPEMEAAVREAVLKLAARKRALEGERGRLQSDLEAMRADRAASLTRAETAESAHRDEIARLTGVAEKLKEELTEAQSEIDDLRARGSATNTNFSGELVALRAEQSALRARLQEQTGSLTTLRQSAEAADARLKRQHEELTKRLEERDNLLAEKDRTIDQLTVQRADAKALEAKVQTITAELNAANEHLHQLEKLTGVTAGEVQRSTDFAEMHKRATSERDHLRDQKRKLESELADAKGSIEEAKTEATELRRELQSQIDAHARELAEERDKSTRLGDDLRKLKEDVIGLRARLRKPA